ILDSPCQSARRTIAAVLPLSSQVCPFPNERQQAINHCIPNARCPTTRTQGDPEPLQWKEGHKDSSNRKSADCQLRSADQRNACRKAHNNRYRQPKRPQPCALDMLYKQPMLAKPCRNVRCAISAADRAPPPLAKVQHG